MPRTRCVSWDLVGSASVTRRLKRWVSQEGSLFQPEGGTACCNPPGLVSGRTQDQDGFRHHGLRSPAPFVGLLSGVAFPSPR